MAGETQSAMTCAEFETLLDDALDHALPAATLLGFQAHAASCSLCGPMLKDAEAGRNALKLLSEVEPPASLVNNILFRTTGLQTGRSAVAGSSGASWWEQLSATLIAPVLGVVRQPRFVMSFGMAFFSVSICLSLAGIKLSDLRTANLRPSAIKRNYYETSGRVVKYYENIRLVYELQSRVREFKQIAEPAQQQDKSKERRNDTSGRPDQKEDRNYSQGETTPLLAETPALAIQPATTPRRSS